MRFASALFIALLAAACDQVIASYVAVDGGTKEGWTVIPAGTANLNAVSGLSDEAVWMVGDRGTIAYWNGTHLTFESSGTTLKLRGVFALDAAHVYAVGDQGTILLRTPTGWGQVGTGLTSQVLTSVWADAQRVVAVGSHGTVILGTTTGYQLLPNSYTENLLSVSGVSGGAATAVGALGLVLELNGTSLTRTPIASFSKLLSGVASSAAASYFVGQQGTIYRSTAAGITSIAGCPGSALRSASIAGNSVWAVGWDGTICELSGATAISYPYTDGRFLNGVYAATPAAVWIVGASGTLLHGLPFADAGVADAGKKDGAP